MFSGRELEKNVKKNFDEWGLISRVTDEQLPLLCKKHPNVTHLNVGYNQIGPTGAAYLSTITTLTFLDINRNDLGAQGAINLSKNTTIADLNACYNEIGDAGAASFGANTTITILKLVCNSIGPEGTKGLSANTTITNLNLNMNKIGAIGALSLTNNTTITELYAFDGPFGYGYGAGVHANQITGLDKNIELNKKRMEEARKCLPRFITLFGVIKFNEYKQQTKKHETIEPKSIINFHL